MKASALLAFAILLTACGTVRTVPVQDSTRVEVKTVERIVRDTAFVELPVIVEKVTTLDTASVLENKYAKSEASVSGGVLTHSLSTKPVREPVIVENQIVYRDSVVYRDRVQVQTVEVEKELSWWQSLKMKCGGIFLAILLCVLLYVIISKYFNLNLF